LIGNIGAVHGKVLHGRKDPGIRMERSIKASEVAVFGLGYVGSVTAACLASLGHRVVGIDTDAHKVNQILASEAPFYEPGLGDLIREGVSSGRLSATTSAEEGLRNADVALICVGTPSLPGGDLDLSQVYRVSHQIAAVLQQQRKPLVVAIRSTVFPGTCRKLSADCFHDTPQVTVASNPEFLREGAAVKDFLEPSLVVLGAMTEPAARQIESLYEPLGAAVSVVELHTAEMIKYACNAFHALKTTFANEIGTLASHLNVNGSEVMEVLCRDTRLNISPAYLRPGFAFGGSCLPKDLRAIEFGAASLRLDLPLLDAVRTSNQRHLERAIEFVLSVPAQRLGLFGLAFKENTDDLRESPVVTLVEQLIGKGREVRIFDPHIQLDQIYGSNQRFIHRQIPHIGRLMLREFGELLNWAEHLVLTQAPPPESRKQIEASGMEITDLTVVNAVRERASMLLG